MLNQIVSKVKSVKLPSVKLDKLVSRFKKAEGEVEKPTSPYREPPVETKQNKKAVNKEESVPVSVRVVSFVLGAALLAALIILPYFIGLAILNYYLPFFIAKLLSEKAITFTAYIIGSIILGCLIGLIVFVYNTVRMTFGVGYTIYKRIRKLVFWK